MSIPQEATGLPTRLPEIATIRQRAGLCAQLRLHHHGEISLCIELTGRAS